MFIDIVCSRCLMVIAQVYAVRMYSNLFCYNLCTECQKIELPEKDFFGKPDSAKIDEAGRKLLDALKTDQKFTKLIDDTYGRHT